MSKKFWPRGVIPALVTPFTKDGKIDEESFRRLIDHLIEQGVTGIVPAGTTGEFMYMKPEERKRVIEIAVEQADGRVPVIAGTGAASTKLALEFTKHAEDVGADAALVVTPYYVRPTDKEVYEHFEKIATSVGIPIVMYNIPQCTGFMMQWWLVEGLAEIDNIVGIKDSSGDMRFLCSLFEKVGGKISIICGHDEIAAAALLAGADGVILASANVLPDIWLKIYNDVKEGRIESVRKTQRRMQKLLRILVRGGALAIKEALRMMSLPSGYPRLPLILGDVFGYEHWEEMRIELEGIGKIPKSEVTFEVRGKTIKSMVPAIPETPRKISNLTFRVGEGFAGPPIFEVAHIDLILGLKDGPVGRVCEKILKQPQKGHEPKVVMERPFTVLVPTVTVRTERHARLVYEHALNGVKMGVEASINDGFLPEPLLDDLVLIANVFVHPVASNARRVMLNNFKAMRYAIRKAIEGRPTADAIFMYKESARHPFRYTP
ncbi:MAG: 4-hydroxy-tetrahydrodipicolinate synthase [Candidatus Baldrarchaeia archaeon]